MIYRDVNPGGEKNDSTGVTYTGFRRHDRVVRQVPPIILGPLEWSSWVLVVSRTRLETSILSRLAGTLLNSPELDPYY